MNEYSALLLFFALGLLSVYYMLAELEDNEEDEN